MVKLFGTIVYQIVDANAKSESECKLALGQLVSRFMTYN